VSSTDPGRTRTRTTPLTSNSTISATASSPSSVADDDVSSLRQVRPGACIADVAVRQPVSIAALEAPTRCRCSLADPGRTRV